MRVALVGCGAVSRNHLTALRDLPDVSVVGLCDLLPDRAEKRRDEFAPDAALYSDYVRMLDEIKPDVVHITTPHYLHCEMACAALARGINVFLEKPVCMKEEEIDRLLDAEKASDGKICVCFQNRFNGGTIAARSLVDEHGGAVAARASVTWKRTAEYYKSSGWRGSKKTEGGGVLINQSIHELDLLIGFLGKPKTVSATVANHHLRGVIEVEDTAELLIGFENGSTGFFAATTAFSLDAPNFLDLYCRDGRRVTLLGDQLLLDGVTVPYEDRFGAEIAVAPGKQCWGTGHIRLIQLFYEALATGSPMPVTVESASDAVRVLLAAYRSKDETIIL